MSLDVPSTHPSILKDLGSPERRDGAFVKFWGRYRPVIREWCERLGLQDADAEDLTQEILWKLAEKVSSFNPGSGPFRSWLKTVVKYAVIDYQRKRRRSPDMIAEGGTSHQERMADLVSPEAAEAFAAKFELLEWLKSEIGKERFAAFLRLMNGWPAGRIAEELGMSKAAVYQFSYRTRAKLQKRAEETARDDPATLEGDPGAEPR